MHTKPCYPCFFIRVIVIIGALNWGLIGALNVNLVEMLFGSLPVLVRVVYVAVGLAGVLSLVTFIKSGGRCECKSTSPSQY